MKEFKVEELQKDFQHISCPVPEYANEWNDMYDSLMVWYKTVLEHCRDIYPDCPESVASWARMHIGFILATTHWDTPISLMKECYPSVSYTEIVIDKATENLQRLENEKDIYGILGIEKLDWRKLEEEYEKMYDMQTQAR